jgi:hypothetical protein
MFIGIGMNLVRGEATAFSPVSLFAASEPGAWYDPSDLSTLFQNIQSTPVTAAAQPVAVMLDKSQGLALGAELVSNGGFDTGTGWSLGTGWSISGGVAVATASASGQTVSQIATTLVVGRAYRCSFTIVSCSAGSFAFRFTTAVGASYGTPGTYSYVFVYNGGTQTLAVRTLGTTTGSIDNISVKAIAGNHARQTTDASRPTYQVDGGGKSYLSFDGTDDDMVTGTITPGIDKVQVFAGLRNLGTSTGIIIETSVNAPLNSGNISLNTNGGGVSGQYRMRSVGTLVVTADGAGFTPPNTSVVTGLSDITAPVVTLRVNGVQIVTSAATQGTGIFNAHPLYIGRRGTATLPFNGRIYSMIVRFGANLTAGQISSAESYVNSKTGAY